MVLCSFPENPSDLTELSFSVEVTGATGRVNPFAKQVLKLEVPTDDAAPAKTKVRPRS